MTFCTSRFNTSAHGFACVHFNWKRCSTRPWLSTLCSRSVPAPTYYNLHCRLIKHFSQSVPLFFFMGTLISHGTLYIDGIQNNKWFRYFQLIFKETFRITQTRRLYCFTFVHYITIITSCRRLLSHCGCSSYIRASLRRNPWRAAPLIIFQLHTFFFSEENNHTSGNEL